jgi:hypothetical protein
MFFNERAKHLLFPTSKEVQFRIKLTPNHPGLLCKPVYMITGLKIAKGFALKGKDSTTSGFTAEGGAQVAPNVSVGAKAKVSTKDSISDQFESENDIIFAYQLLKIKPKGKSAL